ncbi:MAG: metallophosphoesterase [Desulfomonilaceae bacterium]
MNSFLAFLWILSCALILCQWFVLLSVRRYLFGAATEIGRLHAYALLILLGVINVGGVVLSMNSRWFPMEPFYQKAAAVIFFSYLGFALVMALYFGLMRLVEATANLVQRTFRSSVSVSHVGRLAVDERGCLARSSGPQNAPDVASDAKKDYGTRAEELCGQPEGSRTPQSSPTCAADITNGVLERRTVLKMAAAGGLLAGTAMLGEGIVEAYQQPVTEEWDFEHPMLSGLTRPLTIVHATDFHFGMFLDVDDLAALVDRLNRIEGDALVLTGDIYHSPLTPVEKSVPILKRLKSRQIGNFAVLGNHEFYAGVTRSLAALEEARIKVLRNEWYTYAEGRTRVHIGGIDDPVKNWLTGASFPKFAYLMKIIPREPGFRLLLSHRPTILPEAAKAHIDLVLSGHTHGGQIILPSFSRRRGVSVARLISPFTHGWYRIGGAKMYLNRGVGLTFVPWRINCPPEIAVFRLGNGNAHV